MTFMVIERRRQLPLQGLMDEASLVEATFHFSGAVRLSPYSRIGLQHSVLSSNTYLRLGLSCRKSTFAHCELFLDIFAFCEFNRHEARLHVITRKKLLDAAKRHSDLTEPLDAWYRIAKKAQWRNLVDVRRVCPTADPVEKFTVFNIKGNAYRLTTEINYRTGRAFLRHVLTHAEYSKGAWKQ
jgi:mRNA interferase HigB